MAEKKLTRKEKIAKGVEKLPKRKTAYARRLKDERREKTSVKLENEPSSPRKMRLIVDLIRGLDVEKALAVLKFNAKVGAGPLRKLLLSGIATWESKNEGQRADEANLYVKEAFVDSGRQLKRLRPAPQGRGYRIRKRSNHVTLIIDNRKNS